MKLEDAVIQRLDKILHIYTEAIDSLWASNYMYNPTTGREQAYINHSNRLRLIRHVLWKNYIIEIHKLISKSKREDFSLTKTVELALKTKISKSENILLKQLLVDLEENHAKTIQMIRTLRSKFYAHTDRKADIVDVRTFNECIEFNKIVAILIKKLFFLYKDSDVDTSGLMVREGTWNDFLILADAKNEEIQKMINKNKMDYM